MKISITVDYKAKTSTGSSIQAVAHNVSLEVHQMIVWALDHPELAKCLLPRYHEIRGDWDRYSEGSAKNQGFEP
ncbi:MAG: hypothetical protein AAFO57_00215 [Pseudomonadota bacterium]|nr:hypothetical protein [Ralstonia sp.]